MDSRDTRTCQRITMPSTTFAEKILTFNKNLSLDEVILPDGIYAMNPFCGEHKDRIEQITTQFYKKFYADQNKRHFIIGINPGRFGAGLTGVPFTDTKRLYSDCDITVEAFSSHEPSSVFVYEVIRAYGGATKFYKDFYISSLCPLGFVKINEKERDVNYNYYDQKDLADAVTPFILKTLQQQIDLGLATNVAFVLGSGKNFKFIQKLNQEHHFFEKLIPLDHPRFVIQYRNKQMADYVEKYLTALKIAR